MTANDASVNSVTSALRIKCNPKIPVIQIIKFTGKLIFFFPQTTKELFIQNNFLKTFLGRIHHHKFYSGNNKVLNDYHLNLFSNFHSSQKSPFCGISKERKTREQKGRRREGESVCVCVERERVRERRGRGGEKGAFSNENHCATFYV